MVISLGCSDEELLHNSLAGLNNITFYMSMEKDDSILTPLMKSIGQGDQSLTNIKFCPV